MALLIYRDRAARVIDDPEFIGFFTLNPHQLLIFVRFSSELCWVGCNRYSSGVLLQTIQFINVEFAIEAYYG